MSDKSKSWRCTLCGYIHRGDDPPEFCPICGAAATEFEAYEEPSAQPSKAEPEEWRCLNCSYIHDGKNAPELCPICGAGADRFEPVPIAESDSADSADSRNVVIIGAGIAGVSAAETIRKSSPDSSVTLISSESSLPYYRLNLTRYLAGEIDSDSLPIYPEVWYKDNNIDLLLGEKISDVDLTSNEVILQENKKVVFDKLILAMGSHPFIPPLPGNDLQGVFSLRTATDAEAIRANIANGARCVCIGGGILGLETAGALAQSGGNVTLLESHEWLMPRQLDRQAGDMLESHMKEIGVKFRKNARTHKIIEKDDRVSAVLLEDGDTIPAEMIVICTGVRPNTHLARKIGLEVNHGIVVDNHLRTSSPDVYAAGDVSEHNGIVYGVWGPSQYQGSIAGLNALGLDNLFGGLPRSNNLKVLGVDMLSIGQFTPLDGSYLAVREQKGNNYFNFVFRDGKMVGSILLGDIELASNVKNAVEKGMDFSEVLNDNPGFDTITGKLKT